MRHSRGRLCYMAGAGWRLFGEEGGEFGVWVGDDVGHDELALESQDGLAAGFDGLPERRRRRRGR